MYKIIIVMIPIPVSENATNIAENAGDSNGEYQSVHRSDIM